MVSRQSLLIIFSKAPVAGRVNTRLIPYIGVERATTLQHELVLHRMQQFSHRIDYDVELWCAPDTHDELFQYCHKEYSVNLQIQTGSDLGERMFNAFVSGLSRYKKVVLVGTDAPAVNNDDVHQALQSLDNNDVIIKPAEDGGYVLIAMNQAYEVVFDEVNWGSGEVLSQTRDNISQLGISYHELATGWDIDRPEDLARYECELKQK